MLGRYSATSMLAYSRMAGRARGFVASGWVRVLGLVIAVTIVAWLAELARVTAFAKEPLPAGAWLVSWADPGGHCPLRTALVDVACAPGRSDRSVRRLYHVKVEKFARTGAFLPALRRTRSYPRPLSKRRGSRFPNGRGIQQFRSHAETRRSERTPPLGRQRGIAAQLGTASSACGHPDGAFRPYGARPSDHGKPASGRKRLILTALIVGPDEARCWRVPGPDAAGGRPSLASHSGA